MIDLDGSWDPTAKTLGALLCRPPADRPPDKARPCVTPFAIDKVAPHGGAGYLTFVTRRDAKVKAAAAGLVDALVFLRHDPSSHSDIFNVSVRLALDSAFWLDYVSVAGPAVAVGDAVEAGQVLGRAGDHFDPAFGTVAVGVRRHQQILQRLCPTRYADAAVMAAWDKGLAASSEAWPAMAEQDLCATASLVCVEGDCAKPGSFEPAHGDVDAGRAIYKGACAGCHGAAGEGSIGGDLCRPPGCDCVSCSDHATLAKRIAVDMPIDAEACTGWCAADVAAFILHEFR